MVTKQRFVVRKMINCAAKPVEIFEKNNYGVRKMKKNHVTGYKTVPEFVEQISEKFGENIAFIFEKGDRVEEITYKEFSYIVAKNTKIMHDVFGTNRCIAIVGDNSVEWVILYFSILR